MNKSLVKMRRYGVLISQVMEVTEGTQETMNPKFTALREAIDQNQLADFDTAAYTETIKIFKEGTQTYEGLYEKLAMAEAPARLIGNHKMLVSAYRDFVDGCQAMVDSLHETPSELDVEAFNAAEQAQDEASGRMMKRITRASEMV